MEPFTINVDGYAEIPHPAERALIDVVVSNSGPNKAFVSENVLTTAKHLESIIKELIPGGNADEAKEASPLAHWSKTSLSATSYRPYNNQKEEYEDREYKAAINFDIRFKEFKALGGFGARLSALSHVEVNNIKWILTDATENSFRSQLRKDAARDALHKARDYCEVMDCTNVRPVELEEIRYSSSAGRRGNSYALASQELGGPGTMGMARGGQRSGTTGDDDRRDESPLEFRPEEVKMTLEINVKFHAEAAPSKGKATAGE